MEVSGEIHFGVHVIDMVSRTSGVGGRKGINAGHRFEVDHVYSCNGIPDTGDGGRGWMHHLEFVSSN